MWVCVIVTLEGLTNESKGSLLVSDGGLIDEGFDGGKCTALSVSFENRFQHLRCLSPCEVR